MWGKRLFHVPPGRVSCWETPEIMAYNHWSPLESPAYFTHQIKLVAQNSKRIIDQISISDLLRVSLPLLMLTPLVTWIPGRGTYRFRSVWMLATVAIYCSGFVLIYYEPRYTEAFLWPLLCMYCLGFCAVFYGKIATRIQLPRTIQGLVLGLVILSFAAVEANRWQSLVADKAIQEGAAYRAIAQELDAAECEGPLAVMPGTPTLGLAVAYHVDKPFAGCPPAGPVHDVEAALREVNVRTFLVPLSAEAARSFCEQTSWREKLRIQASEEETVVVFVAPS